jgi:hypothetical protein
MKYSDIIKDPKGKDSKGTNNNDNNNSQKRTINILVVILLLLLLVFMFVIRTSLVIATKNINLHKVYHNIMILFIIIKIIKLGNR